MTGHLHRARRRSLAPGATVATVAAVVVVVGLSLAGCSGGSSDADGPAKTSDAAVTLEATTTTAEAVATTAATTLAAPVGLPGQEEVARRLYDAWFADDRATASTVADPAAIDNMWKTERGDYALYNACSTGEFDTSGCLYRGNLGTIQFDLEKRGDNWVVSGTFFSPR